LIVLALQLLNFFLLSVPQYPRLILNEALFVLLPSLLYLRWAGLPFHETVRLRNPGWKVALASFFIGAGLYPISVVSGAVLNMLLGYNLAGTEALLPQNPSEGVLAIIAYAVMAPLCEEIFSRGIIQRAYEGRFSPGKAILLAGGLFIMFHLSLLQGLTIIPLSLALGYVYWRSSSLVASILTHFGANAMAALVVTSNVFWKDATSVLVSPLSVGIGLLLTGGGFWLLRNSTSAAPKKPNDVRSKGFKRAWPLLLAGLLYLIVIGYEFTTTRFPERFHDPVTVGATQLENATAWNYEMHNAADDPVAEVRCRLEPEGNTIVLHWESVHQAYDVQTPGGRYMGGNVTKEEELSFRRADGQPLQGTLIGEFDWGRTETEWSFDGEHFFIHHKSSQRPDEVFELALEDSSQSLVLESTSWPWVLRSLPFASGYVGTAYYFKPYTWRQATQDNGPVVERVLVTVTGPETLGTPTGTLQAWKVKVGCPPAVGQAETAWYSVDAPHVLLKHHNGFETMVLARDASQSYDH
jgi:membrane protease YdiL (CAAX protease family)